MPVREHFKRHPFPDSGALPDWHGDALRIGTKGLSAGEAGLLRALVALIANGRGVDFPWVYAAEGAGDAVLVREQMHAFDTGYVLRLGDQATERLPQPLTVQGLERCLDRMAAVVRTGQSEGEPALPLASSLTAAQPARAQTQTQARARYRLRRWPPVDLLSADKQRVRLATILSRQSLAVDELVDLSRVPAQICQAFVDQLLNAELLIVARPVALVNAIPPQKLERAVVANQSHRGLVSSIRRKLGLN